MPLSRDEALRIAKESVPSTWQIRKIIDYNNLYLLTVEHDLPGEEGMDQLFSVNKETREFRDYSIFSGDISRIIRLFNEASRE